MVKELLDSLGVTVDPTLILANHYGNRLGNIIGVSSVHFTDALTEAPEMTFTVARDINGERNYLWDQLSDIKAVHYLERDVWMQMQVETTAADSVTKNITARGLCQSELSQILLHGIEFNTEDDIARDDYERSIIYNPQNANASILTGIFEKAPHYKIKHVDSTIASQQKTFTFDGVSIQDALNEICEECHCIVIYNNGTNTETNMPAREISLYDLEQVCNECEYRGEFTSVCPECGSTDIKYGYGKDTRIFVSRDNLTDEVTYTTDLDSVKNCFKLECGDDTMTAAVQACNPNGTPYIWFISEDIKKDMPKALVEKLESYDKLYNYYQNEHVTEIDGEILKSYNSLIDSYKSFNKDLKNVDASFKGYPALMNLLYDIIDFNAFLQSGLMPTQAQPGQTSAAIEAAKLNTESLSPIALDNASAYSEVIVNQMVLAVARIIVDNRYDIKIKSSTFTYNEKAETDETQRHQWVGTFTITNYSNAEDTADTGNIQIYINKDYDRYIKQRVDKILDKTDTEDYSISGLLKMEVSLDDFKESIKAYNLSVLLSIKDACDTCLDTFQAESIGNKFLWEDPEDGVDMYQKYYKNYYDKLSAVVDEVVRRQKEQEAVTKMQEYVEEIRNKIQEALDFEKYLGEDLWYIFCTYRREDVYKNENYISDGLNNAEIFENALDFYKTAEKEIFKSATLQHSITSTLKNLLAIPEFRPLVDSFELGNWLRIEIDDEIYKLRLIKYEFDFDDLENIRVEFSDVTKIADGISDISDLLSKQSSMSSSYGSVKRQAKKGKDSYTTLADWFRNGLDATRTMIMDDQGVKDITIDKHGILIREFDDITETYSPLQMKIINGTLAVTDDNWETIKVAIGKFIYQDPVTGEYINAYGVNGEVIVGNLILGKQLGIYNDNATMTFDENGLSVHNQVNKFTVNPNDADSLFALYHNDEKMLWVDDKGMLHIRGDGAGLDIEANDAITGLKTTFSVKAGEILEKVENLDTGFSSEFSITAEGIIGRVSDVQSGLESVINQKAGEITTSVNDYSQGLSNTITITAKEITDKLEDTKNGLSTSFTLSVEGITGKVDNFNEGLHSLVQQEAGKILQQVTDEDTKLQTSIEETAERIKAAADDVYNGLHSELTVQAGKIESLVKTDEGLESRITQTEKDITSLVKADESMSSMIQQKAGEILEKVENLNTGFTTEFSLTAEGIKGTVTDAKDNLESVINQRAGEITTSVKDYSEGLSNTIEVTAKSITDTLTDTKNGLSTSFSASVTGITTKVDNFNKGLHTLIETKAGEISAALTDEDGKLQTSIEATAKKIKEAADDVYNGLHSELTVQAGKIESLVETDKGLSSLIEQNTSMIQFVVKKDGQDVSKFTLTENAMSLVAEYINLNGLVEFKGFANNVVTSVEVLYALGDSATVAPTGGWSAKAPEWVQGKYMWQKTITHKNGSAGEETTETVTCISGAKGDKGVDGSDGEDAKQLYTWIKYAEDSTGKNMTDIPNDKSEYIGIAYNKESLTESSSASAYTWSKFKGDKGVKGDFGYTWIKYANDNKGAGMSDDPKGKKYIGLAYNKTTATESTNPSDYSWSLIQGTGISSVTRQYCLAGSTLTGQETWFEFLPDYSGRTATNRFYWSRDKIVYDDGTIGYTDAILDRANSNVAAWCKDNNTTLIDGAIIATGSIFADSISVDTLSAIKADLGTITAGVLRSNPYTYTGGDFSDVGMEIDLNNSKITSQYFSCSKSGASISGTVKSTSGTIGGWHIYPGMLQSVCDDIGGEQHTATLNSAVSSSGGVGYIEAITNDYGGSMTGHFFIGADCHIYTSSYIAEYGEALSNRYATKDHGHNASEQWISDCVTAGVSSYFTLYGVPSHEHSTDELWAGAFAKTGHTHNKLYGNNSCFVEVGTRNLLPGADGDASTGGYVLGYKDKRWKLIYALNGTINTSDEREKNIINSFDSRHKQLFMKINPIVFTWKNGEDRIHWGIGAQSFEKAAMECGLKDELAAIEIGDETKPYGMAYTEAQMLAWYVTQENTRDIESLQKENAELKHRISELENILYN